MGGARASERSSLASRAKTRIGTAAQNLAHRVGYDILPYPPPPPPPPEPDPEDVRRAKLLASQGISVVLDVGANTGYYATKLRDAGYEGRIVSFEPLSAPFEKLSADAEADLAWDCRRLALGEEEGSVQINVSRNSFSSSVLEIKERHLESAPESEYVATEEVPVARLDSIWSEVVGNGDKTYLKLDVQGFEMSVLRGAESSLKKIAGVQAELSLVPLYEGAPTYRQLMDYLESRGFVLVGLEPGHNDQESGEMLQADGIFIRRASR